MNWKVTITMEPGRDDVGYVSLTWDGKGKERDFIYGKRCELTDESLAEVKREAEAAKESSDARAAKAAEFTKKAEALLNG